MNIPEYWKEFLDKYKLRGCNVEIPDGLDLSGFGVNMEIYSEEEVLEEMNDFYPGIVVKHDFYLPIGACLNGSGDPYFINVTEGVHGKLYRIHHEEVCDEEYDITKAVDIVLEKYELLIDFRS